MEEDSEFGKTLLYGQEVALFKDKEMPTIDGRRMEVKKRAFMYSSGFMDRAVEAQTITIDPGSDMCAPENVLQDFRWREKMFRISPRIRFDSVVELRHHLLKEPNHAVSRKEDIQQWEKRRKMLKERSHREEVFNKDFLKFTKGKPVKFGTHVHLIHAESGYFCDVLQNNDGENHYQVKLSKYPSQSGVFIFESVHKMRSSYAGIQLADNIKIYHEKTRMFLCLEPIKETNKLGIQKNTVLAAIEDSTVLDYDLSNLVHSNLLTVALQSSEDYWNMELIRNSYDEPTKMITTNTLVRIQYPTFDSYLAADFAYEGEKENVYCDGYRGETDQEKMKTKHIWICKTPDFGEFYLELDRSQDAPFYLQHFLTGKLICKKNKSGNALYLDNSPNDAVPAYALPAMIHQEYLIENEPVYLRFTTKSVQAMVDQDKEFSRDQLNNKFESSMSRKTRREYFKPISDEDIREVKHALKLALNSQKNDENNCVVFEKVTPEEGKMLYYLRAFLGKALVAQNQVLLLKHKRIEYRYMHTLNELLEHLAIFLFDLEDVENPEVPFDDPDLVNPKKQMLIRDVGILDLIINILHYPLKIKKAYERPMDMIVTLNKLMVNSYRTLRNVIMEYRPNELYASQWLGFLIEDVFNNHSNVLDESRKTLKELYDNNQRVLETRIDMDTIFKFVYFLAENKHPKYFDFFDALIICNGKPIVINQNRIARIILDDDYMKSKLVLSISGVPKSSQVQVSIGENYLFNNVLIEDFKNVCKRNNAGNMYKFTIKSIKLFSNLCLGKNKIAIEGLKQLYPLRLCIKIIVNEKVDFDMRSAFAELTHHLWSISEPNKKRLRKLSRTKVWSLNSKAETNYDMFYSVNPKTYEEFLVLYHYLTQYFEGLLETVEKNGFKPDHLDLTVKLFELLRDLVEIRVLSTTDEINALKTVIKKIMYFEFPAETVAEDEDEEPVSIDHSVVACKVICLDILKLFINIEIDIEIEKMFRWIRKKCVEILADQMKANFSPRGKHLGSKGPRDLDTLLQIEANTVEIESLINTIKLRTTRKHLSKLFEQFVDNNQLDESLLQFLIKKSIAGQKNGMQLKSLELLLDMFSIGFYIEQYLSDLLLIKEGEEGEFYEKIIDSCSFLENNKEKYKTRVFTDSEEFEYFIASMNLLMSEVSKNVIFRNPYHFLLENEKIEITLRQTLYIRFLKTYAKPPSIFQNLNESLNLIDTILDILSVDRLTFYELCHSRDQKFVVYNLMFEYLRIVCIDSWRVKYHVFKALESFIASIDTGCGMFYKYMTFFEELVMDNPLILNEPTLVQNYVDCILTWVADCEDELGSYNGYLMGILPKLTVLEEVPKKENQQIVLSSLFSKKHAKFFNKLRGMRLQILIKTIISEQKNERLNIPGEVRDTLFIIPDERIRFLTAFVQTLISCVEGTNPLLEKFCQNIFPLEFFEATLSLKGLNLDLRLPLVQLLHELYIKTKYANKITFNYLVDTLIDSCMMQNIKDSMRFFIDRFPLNDDIFVIAESGVYPLSKLHETNIMYVVSLMGHIAENLAKNEASLRVLGPKLALHIRQIRDFCIDQMKALPNANINQLERLFSIGNELTFGSQKSVIRSPRLQTFSYYRSVNLGSMMNLSRLHTGQKMTINMQPASSEFCMKPVVDELYNLLKSEDFSQHYEKNFKIICSKLSESSDKTENGEMMKIQRIGCALIQSLCNDPKMENINSRMYHFCFKWLKYYLRSSKNIDDLRIRQDELLSYNISVNLHQIFSRLTDLEVTIECIELYINLLKGRNRLAQTTIVNDLVGEQSKTFLSVLIVRMKQNVEEIVGYCRKSNANEYSAKFTNIPPSLEDLMADHQFFQKGSESKYTQNSIDKPIKYWKFLELLCTGQFAVSQDLFREKMSEMEDSSFISFSIKVFGSFAKYIDDSTAPLVKQILTYLIEVVKGPNSANQKLILQSKFFDNLKEYIDEYQDLNKNLQSSKRALYEQTISLCIQLSLCTIEGTRYHRTSIQEISKNIQMESLYYILHRSLEDIGVDVTRIKSTSSHSQLGDLSNSNLPRSKTFDKKLAFVFQLYFFVKYMSDNFEIDDNLLRLLPEDVQQSLGWLEAYTGMIEVIFHGNLEVVCFVLQPATFSVPEGHVEEFIDQACMKTFLNRMYLIIEYSKRYRYCADYTFDISHGNRFMGFIYRSSTYIGISIMILSTAVNIACLSTDNYHQTSTGLSDDHSIFRICRLMMTVVYAVAIVLLIVFNMPMIVTLEWNKMIENDNEGFKTLIDRCRDESEKKQLVYLTNLMKQEVLKLGTAEFSALQDHLLYSIHGLSPIMGKVFKVLKTMEILLSDRYIKFYLCMLMAAAVGAYFNTNLFIPIFLLQICIVSPTLSSLIQSLLSRSHAFLLVYCLIAVLLLIFSIFGFFFISENFFLEMKPGTGENTCTTSFSCFLTTILHVV